MAAADRSRRCGPEPALRPDERQVDVRAGPHRARQKLEHRAQDRTLTIRIAGSAERPAHRVADARQPRHANRARQVGNHRQRNGRDAARLEHALHQSHGPAAAVTPAPVRPRLRRRTAFPLRSLAPFPDEHVGSRM